MDTQRDREQLEKLWASGTAPWAIGSRDGRQAQGPTAARGNISSSTAPSTASSEASRSSSVAPAARLHCRPRRTARGRRQAAAGHGATLDVAGRRDDGIAEELGRGGRARDDGRSARSAASSATRFIPSRKEAVVGTNTASHAPYSRRVPVRFSAPRSTTPVAEGAPPRRPAPAHDPPSRSAHRPLEVAGTRGFESSGDAHQIQHAFSRSTRPAYRTRMVARERGGRVERAALCLGRNCGQASGRRLRGCTHLALASGDTAGVASATRRKNHPSACSSARLDLASVDAAAVPFHDHDEAHADRAQWRGQPSVDHAA